MEYKNIQDIESARICNNLLTKLIMSERKYDSNIKETFVVNNYYENEINRDNKVLIGAFKDNIIVGFIFGYIKYKSGNFVENSVGLIDALYVEDNYRKQGIATDLINEFNKWCNENKVKSIQIGVFVNNEAAYNLYKKLGYELDIYYMKKEVGC